MLQIMQRICWNTREWQMPSGATNEKGFPGENGFGHEEWNFQLSDTWNGYIFPYTYQVPQQKILNKNNGIFNVGFFSRHQEEDTWLFVGIHRNVQIIKDSEYKEIVKLFKKNGTFQRRAEELYDATKKFKTFKKAYKEVVDGFSKKYIGLKSPIADVELFSQPIPIRKPSNHRFKSFTYVDNFPVPLKQDSIEGNKHSALAEDGYFRESSSKLRVIIPEHNKLSNQFCSWLRVKGISASQEKNYIDILFEHKGKKYIAELKVVYGAGTTKSIREALGQLLEYNFYPGRERNDEWLIIIDSKPLKKDLKYIDNLTKEIQIPLYIGWLTKNDFEFYPKWAI